MAFCQCCFSIHLNKIILPKVLQNLELYLLAQGTELKRFFLFPRNIQYRARLKSPPFKFFRHCATSEFFSPKGPLQFFWNLLTEWMLKNPKGSNSGQIPTQFFGIVRLFFRKFVFAPKARQFGPTFVFFGCCRREYFDTLKSSCYFLLGPVPACYITCACVIKVGVGGCCILLCFQFPV